MLQHDIDEPLPPRHANEQFERYGALVDFEKRQPGDLLFFVRNRHPGTLNYITIGHVAVIVDKDSYVHSPGTDGRVVSCEAVPDLKEPEDNLFYSRSLYVKRPTLTWAYRWQI